jgi:hypothetical protein
MEKRRREGRRRRTLDPSAEGSPAPDLVKSHEEEPLTRRNHSRGGTTYEEEPLT